jgi:hypothetical protein
MTSNRRASRGRSRAESPTVTTCEAIRSLMTVVGRWGCRFLHIAGTDERSIFQEVSMTSQDERDEMKVENVEYFDIRIFESRDLVVSVVPVRAPWRTSAENYALGASEPTRE